MTDTQETPPGPGRRLPGQAIVLGLIVGSLLVSVAAIALFSKQRHAFDFDHLCEGNLRSLASAIASYRESFGSLPPAVVTAEDGTPMHSWRVLMLASLREDNIETLRGLYHMDEPWNGPRNRTLRNGFMPFAYNCPTERRVAWQYQFTRFVAITGPGTVWSNPSEPDARRRVLLIEYHKDDICWLDPRDLSVDHLVGETIASSMLGLVGPKGQGPLILFSDGSVERLPAELPIKTLRSFVLGEGP
jgi:hypothetical protein